MSHVVELRHDYPGVSPTRLSDLVTDYAALHEVSKPLVVFTGVPSDGHVRAGDDWTARVRLLGVLPAQDYRMTVKTCDAERMSFRSEEKGAGVDAWVHEVAVYPRPDGSRLTERVTVEAGARTPVFAAWARFLYGRRHRLRLAILAR